MSYYDYATALAHKLGPWREERAPRAFELEALAAERRSASAAMEKQSPFKRCLSFLGIGGSADELNKAAIGDSDNIAKKAT